MVKLTNENLLHCKCRIVVQFDKKTQDIITIDAIRSNQIFAFILLAENDTVLTTLISMKQPQIVKLERIIETGWAQKQFKYC